MSLTQSGMILKDLIVPRGTIALQDRFSEDTRLEKFCGFTLETGKK